MVKFAQVGDFKNCNKALILKYACEGLYYMIEWRNDESVLPPPLNERISNVCLVLMLML